jgi:mannosyltransferase
MIQTEPLEKEITAVDNQPKPKPANSGQLEFEVSLVIAILGVGLLLRLTNLTVNSISNPEAIDIRTARETPLKDTFFYGVNYIIQPPFYFPVMNIWTKMFGSGEFAVRALSVLCSMLTLVITYGIARLWLNRNIALIGLGLLAVAPFDLYWSQSARVNALFTLTVALSTALAILITRNPKQNWRWLLYIISAIISSYTSYLALLVLPFQIIFIVILFPKKRGIWLRLGISVLVIGLAFMPYLEKALAQFQNAPGEYSANPGVAQIFEAFQNVLGLGGFVDNSLIYVVGAVFLPLFFSGAVWLWQNQRQMAILLLGWSVLPVVVGWLAASLRNNFNPRFYSFCLPAFMLVVAAGIWGLYANQVKVFAKSFSVAYLLIIATIGLNLFVCVSYFQQYKTQNFRAVVNYVSANNQTGDLVFLANDYGYSSAAFYYYYTYVLNTPGRLDYAMLPSAPSKEAVENALKGFKRIWVVDLYDGSNYAQNYVIPNLVGYERVYSQNYKSIDQGEISLSLYVKRT